MTDIWRSFVAQKCLWAMGSGLLIRSPEVKHDRHNHILLDDFKNEVDGYVNNKGIVDCLNKLKLSERDPLSNLISCYETLVENKFFPKKELTLVKAWVKDISQQL